MSGAVAVTTIHQVGPRGAGTSTLRTTPTILTFRGHLSTMSNLLKKRRPTVSGSQNWQSSCTRLDHRQIRDLTDFPSEKAAVDRCDEDASRHRQGVSRCLSPPQVVFGRHLCTDQTLRSPFPSNRAATLLTHFTSGMQRCRRQTRRPYPVAHQVEGKYDNSPS